MTILVVGSTGQLGSAVVRALVAEGKPVRVLTRDASAAGDPRLAGAEIVRGDLRDRASLDAACTGVDAVIATANVVLPRKGDTFATTEGKGYRDLIAACRAAGVRQFVYISVPVTPIDERVPTVRSKRAVERELLASGLEYTIWRSAPFAEVWFALCGCATVTRGAPSTPARSFWFTRVFLKFASGLVERRGIALVPGDGNALQAFVSIDDVAALLARSVGHPAARNAILDLGGPDVMTWNDAAQMMGRVLGRPVKAIHTPTAVYRAQMALLRPVSEHAANIMGLNWFATYPTAFEMGATYATFGVRPTRIEDMLRRKAALPSN